MTRLNKKPISFLLLVRLFLQHLEPRRKNQLLWLLLLMVIASFAEVLSLGAVIPFLGVLTEPERLFHHPESQQLLAWFQIASPSELLLPVTVAFIFASLFAGGMRLVLLYVNTRLSFSIGADFSSLVYRTTLYQPYTVHVTRNTSEVISAATTKVNTLIFQFLVPSLLLLSGFVIFVAILLTLMLISLPVSIAAFAGFGIIYSFVLLVTRRRVALCSQRMSMEGIQIIKVLQEGLGGIRDVLINNTQEIYCRKYQAAERSLRNAQASSNFIGGAPRFVAEAIGMAFIAVLAYLMTSEEDGLGNTIVLLGALAMGAQRLLPLLQQSYNAIIQIRGSFDSVQDVLELLESSSVNTSNYAEVVHLPFQHSIKLKDVEFSYAPGSKKILSNVNFCIKRGQRIGFIGTTGSGKTTLLDLVMGLLKPTSGKIWVDGNELNANTQLAWQLKIAHVSQDIYLSDATLAENIAFGVPSYEIEKGRLYQAAKQAQIAEYIDSLPNQYDTFVGERGIRLSGGQRQRIAIARALYKRAEVIVLDEATSALDGETECAVMDAIDELEGKLTMLIVAHRLTTLKRCDQIVMLNQGKIDRVGSYQDIINTED